MPENPTVIVQLQGGLGNQLFQYAAARSVAIRNSCQLKLDISFYEKHRAHAGFQLFSIFDLPAEIASSTEIASFTKYSRRALSRLAPWTEEFYSRPLLREPHFRYWSRLEERIDGAYLIGYWQSPRYFNSIEQCLRRDLAFRAELSFENQILANDIQMREAISLHIRRGDYLTNPSAHSVHGVCGIGYYNEALNLISAAVNHPVFFVFSDDLDWARANLPSGFDYRFVAHNTGQDSFNDMRLMQACQHHIIANSSFSWWGAWLNPSLEKKVIAPARWFADTSLDTTDLLPREWIRL